MDRQDRFECEATLDKMRQTSSTFYGMAVRTGCHAFIEFTGLMNEYIGICSKALEDGIDFRDANTHGDVELPIEDFNIGYLGEKLNCIYGPGMNPDRATKLVKILCGSKP